MTIENQQSIIEKFIELSKNKNGKECIVLLEENENIIDYRDESLNSLLHFAVYSGDLDLIK